MEHKTAVIQFRVTSEQDQRLERLAKLAGKNKSEILRDLVDSATVVRPMIVSIPQGGPVHHGQ